MGELRLRLGNLMIDKTVLKFKIKELGGGIKE
jgi:hypothetical protein